MPSHPSLLPGQPAVLQAPHIVLFLLIDDLKEAYRRPNALPYPAVSRILTTLDQF
jgi:hypothetical protein